MLNITLHVYLTITLINLFTKLEHIDHAQIESNSRRQITVAGTMGNIFKKIL